LIIIVINIKSEIIPYKTCSKKATKIQVHFGIMSIY
jgi:hypothetical protein